MAPSMVSSQVEHFMGIDVQMSRGCSNGSARPVPAGRSVNSGPKDTDERASRKTFGR